ncbi:MAG: tetratricopeptide repeat protein, partial [Candidatus Sericytochromatia bacterium]
MPISDAEVYFQAAQTLQTQGQLEAAVSQYQQALQRDPRLAEGYFQLGQLQQTLGQPVQAVQNLLKYVQFCPDRADVYLVIGNLLLFLNQHEQAQRYFLKALEIEPGHPEALSAWLSFKTDHDPAKMLDLLLSMAQSQPELRSTIACQVGRMMETIHNSQDAAKCYALALEDPLLSERQAWELKSQVLVPVIPPDKAYQEKYLQATQAWLAQWEQAPAPETPLILPDFSNADPYFLSWQPLEGMAYTYLNPYRERQRLGAIFKRWLPVLPTTQRVKLRSQRRRVGFVLGPSGAVLNFMVGLLQRLPPTELDIHILHTHRISAAHFSKEQLRPEFSYHLLADELATAYQQVLALDLDILYLTEPNAQQSLQAVLSAFRLAPVQVTSWLSSGSTGQPYMDYFLSSHLLEQAENPQRFYSEQLVLHSTIPTYFFRPKTVNLYTRTDYGLPEEGHLYLCPHVMNKIQPDLDPIFAGILRQDPLGHLVLLTNPDNVHYRRILVQRFENSFPDLMPRIWFLPYLKPQEYLNLLTLGDVMLDPLYFGGGTTTYEALSAGIPIITWPADRLHGRITHACYLKMGLSDCVAHSADDYIHKAVSLGTDLA